MPPPPPFVHPRQSLPSDPWSSQGRTSVESKLDAPRLWKPLPTRRCLYLLNLNTIYLLTGGNPGFCQQSLGDSSSSRSGIQRSQLGPGFVAETTFRRGTCQVILQGSGHIFFFRRPIQCLLKLLKWEKVVSHSSFFVFFFNFHQLLGQHQSWRMPSKMRRPGRRCFCFVC